MRTRFIIVVLVAFLSVAACSQSTNVPVAPSAPPATTDGIDRSLVPTGDVEVPFHAEVDWSKVEGSDVALCTVPLPSGKVYLMRNRLSGPAVSTHLGAGTFVGHTCVYGTRELGPEGWLMDVRWTAANGDVLLSTAEFVRWTGAPGSSVAIENVTFHDGGTGRFQYAEGSGTCYVNAPERTATYDATIRYGKTEK